MKLEILSQRPKGKAKPIKLLFVHGICVGAWIWETRFLPYFSALGYEAHAVSLRGHAGSEGRPGFIDWSLSDYTADLHQAVATIGGPVVVVGHSMGGAVVQNYLRTGGKPKAAALLASVPPWGLAPSAMRMAFKSPRLFQAFASMTTAGVRAVDQSLMRAALFSDDLPDAAYKQFQGREQDESRTVSAELQGMGPFAPLPWMAPPMFVAGGSNDQLIPSDEVWKTAAYYGVSPVLIDGLAHTVMLDTKWKDMADALHAWLGALT